MTQPGARFHSFTEDEVTQILTCVVAFSGNTKAAVAHLKEEGDLGHVPEYATVHRWMRGQHRDLYNSLREQNTEQIDQELADRYRGVAMQAVEATELGVRTAKELLESGKDRDPAKSAANLASVADKTLRDYSLLEGKPTAIREDRTLPDVMRTLFEMGVLVPHAQPEIEEATSITNEDET
jgi:hypothetical protein